jgi:hypothetical protein
VDWDYQFYKLLRLLDRDTEVIAFDMPRPKSHDVGSTQAGV